MNVHVCTIMVSVLPECAFVAVAPVTVFFRADKNTNFSPTDTPIRSKKSTTSDQLPTVIGGVDFDRQCVFMRRTLEHVLNPIFFLYLQ